MSIACTRSNRPPVLRRGWAEKRIMSERKTDAHTWATRRTRPAWARTAVPGDVREIMDVERGNTYDEIVIERSAFLL
jgi:hypothetical protein